MDWTVDASRHTDSVICVRLLLIAKLLSVKACAMTKLINLYRRLSDDWWGIYSSVKNHS